METKAEQIKRLQGNEIPFYRLDYDDRKLILDFDEDGLRLQFKLIDSWQDKQANDPILALGTYRIHRDYKPEPETPVFPGYVLCEVKPNEGGFLQFRRKSYNWGLAFAPNHGCCGYVFKENTGEIWDTPVKFVRGKGSISSCSMDSHGVYKPATLGWVMFKETE